jgi:hypothetical protein
MAKKAASGLTAMTTAEIHRELHNRVLKAKALGRKRDALLAKVAAIDAMIREYGGSTSTGTYATPYVPKSGEITARGTPRKRPVNAAGLAESLHKVLKGKTMGVTEVAKAVVDAGYLTTAANFRTIVNQCLTNHRKLFKKLGRGKYTAI